jgi:hypothetical protein
VTSFRVGKAAEAEAAVITRQMVHDHKHDHQEPQVVNEQNPFLPYFRVTAPVLSSN